MSGSSGMGVAQTASNAYTAISDTAKAMGKAGSEVEARFNRFLKPSHSYSLPSNRRAAR